MVMAHLTELCSSKIFYQTFLFQILHAFFAAKCLTPEMVVPPFAIYSHTAKQLAIVS